MEISLPRFRNSRPKKRRYAGSIPQMAKDGLASGTPQVNPRSPSEKEIVELLLMVYDG